MSILVPLILAYIGLGFLFGIFFAAKGAAMLDPVAEEAPIGFRLLVIPGAAALWPLLVTKLMRRGGSEQ